MTPPARSTGSFLRASRPAVASEPAACDAQPGEAQAEHRRLDEHRGQSQGVQPVADVAAVAGQSDAARQQVADQRPGGEQRGPDPGQPRRPLQQQEAERDRADDDRDVQPEDVLDAVKGVRARRGRGSRRCPARPTTASSRAACSETGAPVAVTGAAAPPGIIAAALAVELGVITLICTPSGRGAVPRRDSTDHPTFPHPGLDEISTPARPFLAGR